MIICYYKLEMKSKRIICKILIYAIKGLWNYLFENRYPLEFTNCWDLGIDPGRYGMLRPHGISGEPRRPY